MKNNLLLMIALGQALVAMLGSLFFSEILKYPPCVLCWYQRICMYPLVLILGAGLVMEDKKVVWYSLPLAMTGWLIATYHNLLYYKILPESVAPCVNGVSCTTKFVEYFGFVTIPLLSWIAFSVIIGSLLGYFRSGQGSRDV